MLINSITGKLLSHSYLQEDMASFKSPPALAIFETDLNVDVTKSSVNAITSFICLGSVRASPLPELKKQLKFCNFS